MIHDHKSLLKGNPISAYRGNNADRIRRFVPMVRRLAWHVHGGGRQGIELDDLMQAGMVALTEAAQRHAGPGEDGFAAYAKLRVRGAMIDLVRRQIPLSRGGAERRRQLRDAETGLRTKLGRPPSAAELAAALHLTQAELETVRLAAEPVQIESIDETYSDSDSAFADTRPDSFAVLADEEMRECLADAVSHLPERLQLIVQLYFVEELNLAEIAETLQISVPRVHQLKAQAIDRLRAALADIASII
ncbi:MAG: sigma-70 family RNA polymerase sigma factor [Sphingomonadales bacterium]|nr:sigma-70 family RNA polymerase sigma factor [Sphingomonadales bacterium]